MPKATLPSGVLQPIGNCYLEIPGYTDPIRGDHKIIFNNLPEITDSKSAVYNSEGIIGRSSPIHTYSYSDTRNISLQLHFVVLQKSDILRNLAALRGIQSCVYPRARQSAAPFTPPVICRLRVGNLLANEQDLCVVCQQYSVRYPTEVAWDWETACPYKFDIDTTWWVVYTSSDLPSSTDIVYSGR